MVYSAKAEDYNQLYHGMESRSGIGNKEDSGREDYGYGENGMCSGIL
jgi:hypothetical protein